MKRTIQCIWMLSACILIMLAGILIRGEPDTCVKGISTTDLKEDQRI